MQTFYLEPVQNVVSLNLDILSICNFKCPYCYNSKKYRNIKKLLSLDKIQYIIDEINKNKHKIIFDITIVGGEPFMHPQLSKIVEMFSGCNKIRHIDIFTNGSIIKFLKPFKKTRVFFSVHPECDFEKLERNFILNNVEEIMFMCTNKMRVDKYKEYSKRYKVSHTHLISLNGKLHYNDLALPNLKCFHYNDELLSIDDVYSRHLNNFKGWKCQFSIINVDVTGSFGVNCYEHFDENLFACHFLSKYKPDFKTCEREECNEDCYIACYKYNGTKNV